MNEVLWSTVEIDIKLHRGFLCFVSIRRPASIHSSKDLSLSISNTEFNVGEDGVDEHSLS